MTETERISIAVDETHVSGLVTSPPHPAAVYVFAHGAGAGMEHAFMQAAAAGLAGRGIATLRFNFLYMERGSGRPDGPAVAQRCVAAAVATAGRHFAGLPLFAGGKSFGGRMTSQAQASGQLQPVEGLAFVGFPLHPAGKPSTSRAAHLLGVKVPMLFIQGTRDKLAEPDLLVPMIETLGPAATLLSIDDADHAFHVPRRSGRSDDAVLDQVLDGMASWFRRAAGPA